MAGIKARTAVVLGALVILLVFFSAGKFATIAKTEDKPAEQELKEVLRNQDRILSALSNMQSDVKNILHQVNVIRAKVED